MQPKFVFIEAPCPGSGLTKVAAATATYARVNYNCVVCSLDALDRIVDDLRAFAARSCAEHRGSKMPDIALNTSHLNNIGTAWLTISCYTITLRRVTDVITTKNF